MSSSELAIVVNIVFTIIGFLLLYFKQGERITRLETHLIHIMRKLGMSAREREDKIDYVE